MERHFILPVTIAAAIHGALFALPRSVGPEREPVVDPPIPGEVIRVDRMPDDPVEVANGPAHGTAAREPRQIEPVLPMGTEGAFVPVERPVTGKFESGIIRLPTDGIGVPDGMGEAEGAYNVVKREALDHAPRTRVQIAPDYPMTARRDRLSGEVVVEFVVDEAGRVTNTRVTSSSNAMFDAAALSAVSRWRFEPGTVQGRVVRFRLAVPVVFRMSE